jgi:Tol biopolymer transport system component/tRNA A-37 threonylcarbamoyl transferase component Bud32
MRLAAGTNLGSYRIVSFLAAGGMGEVYRATDTRLNRSVAIKVLATPGLDGSDAVRRFEQEARAAAALNHPNILAVYDVGAIDGAPYIVSELLDGQTLRQSLDGRPLPARKAIDYAIQIASGLAAAHAVGVVHRDLKPENLFVTRDGRIKILDFGLAKLLPSPAAISTSASDLTRIHDDTEPGLLLGTVTYMSPEQVRGQPADARSDLYALGAIVYEMVTGRRAFARDTPADTMTAILSEDPPELTRLAAPHGLDRIVRHCLEKLPDQRFQSARDLAFDLEALSETSPSGGAVRAAAPRAGRPLRVALLVAAIPAAAILAWAAFALVPRGAARVPDYQQVTFRKGTVTSARFAPDGRTVVYAAAWAGGPLDVYVIDPGSVESRSLGLSGSDLLAVAASGNLAVSLHRLHGEGFLFNGMLARVPLGGSGPRELLDNVEYADWAPDGSNLAVIREVGGHTRLEYPIGTVLYQTSGWMSDVRVSPAGDRVAFIDHTFRRDDAGSIDVVDRQGHLTVLAPGWLSAIGLAWSGRDVWFTASKEGSNRALYVVTPQGAVRPLASSPGVVTLHDLAPGGKALVTRDALRLDTIVAEGGQTERNLSWLDWTRLRDVSSDGRTILFDETGQGGGGREGVYMRNVDGSPAIRLGDGTGEKLSPDGRWAISLSVDRSHLVLLPTRAGESRTIALAPLDRVHRAYWLPDGNHLLLGASERGHGARFYMLDLAGGSPRAITPEGTSTDGTVSPDGRAIVARSGSGELTSFPVGGGTPRPIPGVNATEFVARWTPDGSTLYVYDASRMPVPLTRVDIATGRRELVKEIAGSNASPLFGIQYLFVTPDLKQYAYTTLHQDSELFVVEGLDARR